MKHRVMALIMALLLGGATMIAVSDPAEARRGGRAIAGAVIGGLALGALAAGANGGYGRYYRDSYAYPRYYRSYSDGPRSYGYYRPTSYYYGGFAPVRYRSYGGYGCW